MPTLQFDSQSNSAASANASKCRMLENDTSDLQEWRFAGESEREREREQFFLVRTTGKSQCVRLVKQVVVQPQLFV